MNYYLSTDPGFVVTMSTVEPPYPFTTSHFNTATSPVDSDVPGIAWAQASGLGWASHGSGLPKHEPGPELRARPGLGLVGLEPGLDFQKPAKWLGTTHLRSASHFHQQF
jgi:hypothetical protein